MLTKLDRVVVAVDDLKAASDDYAQLLGLEPLPGDADAAAPRTVRFELGNAAIELAERDAGLGFAPIPAAAGVAALVFERDEDDADADGGEPAARGEWLERASTRGISIRLEPAKDGARRTDPGSSGDAAARISGLDHVVISTGDLDAARRLYGERLGLRLALDRAFEKRGIQILFFRIAGVTVEVVGRLAGARESEGGPGAFADAGDRFGGLALQVADVRATRARLAGAGFDVSEERVGHKPGTRVCTVKSRTHGVPTLLIGPDLW